MIYSLITKFDKPIITDIFIYNYCYIQYNYNIKFRNILNINFKI